MKIKYNLDKNTLFIHLIGELDECTASKVRDAIDSLIESVNGVIKVVFNLSNLSFMDSTGIGMLIGRYKKLKARMIGIVTEILKCNTQEAEQKLEANNWNIKAAIES